MRPVKRRDLPPEWCPTEKPRNAHWERLLANRGKLSAHLREKRERRWLWTLTDARVNAVFYRGWSEQ